MLKFYPFFHIDIDFSSYGRSVDLGVMTCTTIQISVKGTVFCDAKP